MNTATGQQLAYNKQPVNSSHKKRNVEKLKNRKGKHSKRMHIGKKTWKRTKKNTFELEFVGRNFQKTVSGFRLYLQNKNKPGLDYSKVNQAFLL